MEVIQQFIQTTLNQTEGNLTYMDICRAFDGVTPNSVLDDLSMASSADELIPVGNEDNLVDSDSKAVDDLLNGLEETTNGKGVARNFESSGGYEQTLDDFESLNPINVQDIQTKYGAGKVYSDG